MHGDLVSDVSFCPSRPEIASSSFDGIVRIFKPPPVSKITHGRGGIPTTILDDLKTVEIVKSQEKQPAVVDSKERDLDLEFEYE